MNDVADKSLMKMVEETWNKDPGLPLTFNNRYLCRPEDVLIDQFLTFGDKPFRAWKKDSNSPSLTSSCEVTVKDLQSHDSSVAYGAIGLMRSPDLTESARENVFLYILDGRSGKMKYMHTVSTVKA